MHEQTKSVTLYAAGEVCVNRENPESIVESVIASFAKADIRFFQLETVYSDRGSPSAHEINLRAHPRNVTALKAIGFDVCSFASNHVLDYSNEGLFDTIETLSQNGIQVIGAGKNLIEARKPAILERHGNRVAFLGYNSNLLQNYWATENKPGCVPLRVFTVYEGNSIHPGSSPTIHTFADRRDLQPMLEDIKKAKSLAHMVAVSMHWGLFIPPHTLADYQREVAHMAIDAGADVILGTGPHQIKPIEVYKGRVIFYSLGNFAFDFGRKSGIDLEAIVPNWKEIAKAHLGWDIDHEQHWLDNYVFPARSRKAIVAKSTIAEGEIREVSFLPLVINEFAQPRMLSQRDKEFQEVSGYVQELCQAAGLDTRFTPGEDEVVIQT